MSNVATSPVQPVWWAAPSPAAALAEEWAAAVGLSGDHPAGTSGQSPDIVAILAESDHWHRELAAAPAAMRTAAMRAAATRDALPVHVAGSGCRSRLQLHHCL